MIVQVFNDITPICICYHLVNYVDVIDLFILFSLLLFSFITSDTQVSFVRNGFAALLVLIDNKKKHYSHNI